MPYAGEIAALSAALCWAMTAIAFARAGRRIGSSAVNGLRLLFAIGFLTGLMLVWPRGPWPWAMDYQALILLAASGIIGLALGDAALFHAYVLIGPRLGSLMMSLWPAVAAVMGYFLLGERLSGYAMLGMAITMGSVGWVVFERQSGGSKSVEHESKLKEDGTSKVEAQRRSVLLFGVLCALGGVAGQAVGIVLAKMAMLGAAEQGLDPIDPLPATYVRMLTATVVIWLWLLLKGDWRRIFKVLISGEAIAPVFFGSIVGPFLGVWLSLIAGLKTQLGIAGTLMATSPIWVIPMVLLFERERVSARAWIGAVGAFIGVALLFVS
jgi:drug/metabolite transporter (DMT)-like permease